MTEISEELKFNILKLLQLKELSSNEKGEFCKVIIKEQGISMREFSRRYDIPHSTVQDWISGRQMRKYYDDKLNKEFNATTIRNELDFKGLDSLLDRLLFIITKKNYKMTDKTKRLLKDLKNEIERLQL